MKKFSSLEGKTAAELAKKLQKLTDQLGHNNFQLFISGDLKTAIVVHDPSTNIEPVIDEQN